MNGQVWMWPWNWLVVGAALLISGGSPVTAEAQLFGWLYDPYFTPAYYEAPIYSSGVVTAAYAPSGCHTCAPCAPVACHPCGDVCNPCFGACGGSCGSCVGGACGTNAAPAGPARPIPDNTAPPRSRSNVEPEPAAPRRNRTFDDRDPNNYELPEDRSRTGIPRSIDERSPMGSDPGTGGGAGSGTAPRRSFGSGNDSGSGTGSDRDSFGPRPFGSGSSSGSGSGSSRGSGSGGAGSGGTNPEPFGTNRIDLNQAEETVIPGRAPANVTAPIDDSTTNSNDANLQVPHRNAGPALGQPEPSPAPKAKTSTGAEGTPRATPAPNQPIKDSQFDNRSASRPVVSLTRIDWSQRRRSVAVTRPDSAPREWSATDARLARQ